MSDTRIGLAVVLAAVLVAGPAIAQRGGGRGTGQGTGSGGGRGTGAPATSFSGRVVSLPPGWGLAPANPFGNVNHPGGVIPTPFFQPPFFQPQPGVIQPLPTVVQPLVDPFQPFQPNPTIVDPFGRGFGRGFGFGPRVVVVPVPVGVPVPVTGNYPQQPTVIIIQQPYAGGETAGVAGAEGLAGSDQRPSIYTYAPPHTPPTSEDKPASKTLTLLVFKDHSIYAVTDYWVEGDRLHYVTSYGGHNSIALDELDLDFTKRLNEERHIKFDLKKEP